MDSLGTIVALSCVVILSLPALLMMTGSALFLLGMGMQAATRCAATWARRGAGAQGSRLA